MYREGRYSQVPTHLKSCVLMYLFVCCQVLRIKFYLSGASTTGSLKASQRWVRWRRDAGAVWWSCCSELSALRSIVEGTWS